MDTIINPRAVIGGNRPPLGEAYADLSDRAEALRATDLPIMVPDDDTAAKVALLGRDVRELIAAAEKARKDEKEPYIEGGRQVDAFFKGMTDSLAKTLDECKRLVGAWQAKKEAEDRARLEAEARARREAADIAAAAARTESDMRAAAAAEDAAAKALAATRATSAELGRVQAGGYTVAQQRATWAYEVTDIAAVPREYLLINDAKVKAVIAGTKGQITIPGVHVFQRKTTVL